MRLNKIKNSVIFILYFICNQVFAAFGLLDYGMLDQINSSVAFGLSGLNLDYKEVFLPEEERQGAKSTEAGAIIGFYFNPRIAFFNNKIYTDLYLDYYDGKLKYDGVQQKTYVPIVDQCEHRLLNANLKLGYIITAYFNENLVIQAIPYVGTGLRYWDRFYNTIYSREKYYHGKYIGGLKLNFLLGEYFIMSPYLEAGRLFSTKMRICSNGLLYDLGKNSIYEGGLEVNYKLFDELCLNGIASYSAFQYSRSALRGGWFEPGSKTNELKFGLGIRYSWLRN